MSAPPDAATAPVAAGRRLALAEAARRPRLLAGGLVLATVVLVSVLAPVVAPFDPNAGDPAIRLSPPGTGGHLLGTDDQGRDVLSRIMWGGRSSLSVAVAGVAVATALGTAAGLVAGFRRGVLSALLMRFVDALLAFPVIFFALALAQVISPGHRVVIATVVFAAVPYIARIVFAEAKLESRKDYAVGARLLGSGTRTTLLREVLPNVAPTVVVYSTTLVGLMIVFSSSLSALGLGVQPPAADWGRMVSEGARVIVSGSPHVALVPGLVILVVGLAFNWVGDGLRDVIDPRTV